MSTSVFIDTLGALHLSDLARGAAGQADRLRDDTLAAFGRAELVDTVTPERLARIDDELTLLGQVLAARASLAAYRIDDAVARTLAADALAAEQALSTFLGPDPTRVADGERAAAELRDGPAVADPALLAVIAAGADDPSFVLGFTRALGVDGAGVAIVRSSTARPDAMEVSAAEMDDWTARHRALLGALGSVYARASHGTGAFAGPAADAEAWVRAITVAPLDADYPGQGVSAALLLASHDLPPALLAAVADGVYAYERATAQDGQPLWRPRVSDGYVYYGPLDADLVERYDPLVSILAALGRQPDAAQAFFANATTVTRTIDGVDRQVNERLAYLFQERRWPVDAGAAFGEALVAATTHHRDLTDAGRLSAELASQTLSLVAATTGTGDGWFDDGWWAPTGTRHALALIVADYMPDVFHLVNVPESDPLGDAWFASSPPGFPPDGPFGLEVSRATLATVIETIGRNPDDARHLLAAVLGTQQLRTGHALDQLLAADPDLADHFLFDGGAAYNTEVLLENAVIDGSGTLGFIVHHAFQGDRAEQADEAAARAMWADLLGTALSLPVVPTPAGPWGKVLISQTTKRVMNAWVAGAPSDATGTYATIDEEVREQMTRLVLDQLAAAGLLHPSAPIAGYEPPPDSAFVVDASTGRLALPLHFDLEHAADNGFDEWYANYAPRSWVNEHVLLPYLGAFPSVG